MKVLVIGANGFIGRAVSTVLKEKHEVVESGMGLEDGVAIDLTNPQSIADSLAAVKPEAIVDCAGVVANNEQAELNVTFTKNLLEQVKASGLPVKRIVIMGSAGEYGPVDKLPVSEDAPRNGSSPYALSKVKEIDLAFEFRQQGLPVVVARLFNPIGAGMNERMLIPGVLRQIAAFKAGETDKIEVNRLDAKRDFIDVSDIGRAIERLLDKEPEYEVYNVGSGTSTTNRQLIDMILEESGLAGKVQLAETSDTPEPQFAVQADISRLEKEFGWRPQKTVADTIRSVVHG
jgi:GDP-4-dehydro-6-deoxy-D-mannose reductase